MNTKLEKFDIPNNSRIKEIGDCAFYKTKISEINLPNNVKINTLAFYNCKLIKITLKSSWEYSYDVYSIFGHNEDLEEVIIEDGAYIAEKMFDECKNLKKVTFSNTVNFFNGSYCFWKDDNISELIIPEGFKIIDNNEIFIKSFTMPLKEKQRLIRAGFSFIEEWED